jgi:DNA-binding LytR/AlgR family response regulator
MTCIIVEDIQLAADFLKNFCEKAGNIEVMGHFLNVPEALTFLDETPVDLIFLDVEMPGATGFDLLDRLTYSPKIILTTSNTEYAFDAFQYNVSDFLKKPFTYKRFQEAMQKIHQQQLDALPAVDQDYLFIRVDGKLLKMQNDDILYIEGMRDYVKFITNAKSYVTHSTLKNLEEKMNKAIFMKVHRSYIVNISKIDDIQGNTIYIQGKQVPIGKGHKDEVIRRLNIL